MTTEHTDFQIHIKELPNRREDVKEVLAIIIAIIAGTAIFYLISPLIFPSEYQNRPAENASVQYQSYRPAPRYDRQYETFQHLPGVQRNPDLIPAKPRNNHRKEEYRSEYRYH